LLNAFAPALFSQQNPPPASKPAPPVTTAQNPAQSGSDSATVISGAEAAYSKGDFAGAIKTFDQILAANPNNSKARFDRGAARIWTADKAGALNDFRELARSEPGNYEARRLRALLELAYGDRAVASKEAGELVRKNPTVNTFLLAAEAAVFDGHTAEAMAYYRQASAAEPRISESCFNQGTQLLNAREPALAYINFSSALYLNPAGYGSYFWLGLSAEQLGWKAQAIDAFQNYLRYDSVSQYAQSARRELQKLKAQ